MSIEELIDKIGFNKEERTFCEQLIKKYNKNKNYQKISNDFVKGKITIEDALQLLDGEASKGGDDHRSLYLIFILQNCPRAYKKYQKLGVEEEIINDTFNDIKIKVNECKRVEGICGLSRPWWFMSLFEATIFKLGRFQYALSEFLTDYYEKEGTVIIKGTPIIDLHIPESDEKMDDEARKKSYSMAYDFFRKFYPEYFHGKYLPITCNTWLFFDKNVDFLDEDSSIVRFSREFDIIEKCETDYFYADFYVFGSAYRGEVENYPRETRLQRAYADWILAGKKTGTAYGIKFISRD